MRQAEQRGDKFQDEVHRAVHIAAGFFECQRVLLVIDSVWARETRGAGDWMSTLLPIASGKGSCVLATSRFKSVVEAAGCVAVGVDALDVSEDSQRQQSTSWKAAEGLFNSCCVSFVNDTSEFVSGRAKALRKSCGIPLAIKIISRLFAKFRGDWAFLLGSLTPCT